MSGLKIIFMKKMEKIRFAVEIITQIITQTKFIVTEWVGNWQMSWGQKISKTEYVIWSLSFKGHCSNKSQYRGRGPLHRYLRGPDLRYETRESTWSTMCPLPMTLYCSLITFCLMSQIQNLFKKFKILPILPLYLILIEKNALQLMDRPTSGPT